jgi:hypothetical protein
MERLHVRGSSEAKIVAFGVSAGSRKMLAHFTDRS